MSLNIATQLTLNIGNVGKGNFSEALNYVDSHGIEICRVRYVSEEKLQRKGYPVELLMEFGIMDGTAFGVKSDGIKTIFYGINKQAISRARRSKWVSAAV